MIKKTNRVKKFKNKNFYSPNKKKVLLLLQVGVALSLTPSLRGQSWFLKQLTKEWRDINRQYLYKIIHEFKHERIVDWKEKSDGSIEIVLTEKGKKKVLNFNIENMQIKRSSSWDEKWRMVIYDIPEKRKKAREAFRTKLKELEFYELQKSVFVHPFSCRNEIDFIIEFFEIRNFVHYIEISDFINDSKLKLHFGLY